MKFNEIRDMVEKMSGSKLTGQELSVWYKKNPDVKKAIKDKAIKQAVEIALDHGGAMNFAIKKIEKIKRGLADHPAVAKALSFANFGEEQTLEDGAGEHSAAAQYAKDTPGQGIQEEKIAILTSVYKSVKREMDTLMKKHDAYVSDTSRAGTTISSSKPMGAFIKDVQKLIGLKESIDVIAEGTWQTPKNKGELKKLMDLVSKPVFATKKADVEKYMKQMPFGDDELYDALESLYYEKDSDGKVARPIKVMSKFSKTDLNQVAMDSLNGRWLTAKKKGSGYDVTHIMFDFDEAVKRKSGSLRPGKKMMVEAIAKIDPMDRAERVLNYKLKELQYKTALKTFNEYDADPEVKKEAKGATGLNNAALVKRVPSRFKGIDQKTAQRVADAVKPKGMISSKLYMELGDLWDKKNTKGFEALLKKHKV